MKLLASSSVDIIAVYGRVLGGPQSWRVDCPVNIRCLNTIVPPTFAAALHAIETMHAFPESRRCMDYHSLYDVEKTVHDTKAKTSVQCSIKDFLKAD